MLYLARRLVQFYIISVEINYIAITGLRKEN